MRFGMDVPPAAGGGGVLCIVDGVLLQPVDFVSCWLSLELELIRGEVRESTLESSRKLRGFLL